MQDKSIPMFAIIVVLVIGFILLGKEKLDNPLFFLAMVSIFVYGFGAVGRLVGTKTNSPGLTTFFGGK